MFWKLKVILVFLHFVLLEYLFVQSCLIFKKQVKKLQHEKRLDMIVDPALLEYDVKEVEQMIQVALLCSQPSPEERPNMAEVVRMLSGDQPPDKNDKVRVEVWSKGSHLSMHSKVMLKNGCLYILIVNSLFKILFDDNDFFVGLEITLCQLRGILVDIKQVRGIGYLW